jgi:hypothetical protein
VSQLITTLGAAAPSPTPSQFPDYTGNPNLITPGVWGFIAIFLVAVATVLLLLDMTRRIRRSRYRAEVREKIAEEQAEAELEAEKAERKSTRSGKAPAIATTPVSPVTPDDSDPT